MEISALWWAAGKAFVIAFVLCPIFRDVFRAYNIVDRPGLRKVHAYPIPRIGGIPLTVAFAVVLLSFPDSIWNDNSPVWKFLPATAMIFLTGLIDDFFHIRPVFKILGQAAAATIAFYSGLRIEVLGQISIPVWIGLPVTIAWLLLCTNAFNLIDGLDGLCAGLGLIATLTFFTAASVSGNLTLQYATLPLIGALLAFLCYNWNPATMFLGDSGALLIGFLLGSYGIALLQNTQMLPGLAVSLLALSIPLTDVLLSILRRFLRHRPIFGADREHVHHRLLDQGLSPRRAVLVLYMVGAIGAAFGILLSVPSSGQFKTLCILGCCLVAWAVIRRLRYAEFKVTGELLFRGGFRDTVQWRVRLQHLASALQKCKTEDEWWKLLVDAARDAGWFVVKWTGGYFPREQVLQHQPTDWSFNIALGENQFVQIAGALQPSCASVDMLGFAEILRSSLAGKRREWDALPK